MEATLSSKNQVTIPKQVRGFLNLKAGDRFKFFFQPDGRLSSFFPRFGHRNSEEVSRSSTALSRLKR